MSATDTKATSQAAPQKKRQRTPINGHREILSVKGKEPGWHYAWIGEPMVFAAKEAGYEHVRHPVQVGTERIDVSTLSDKFVTRNVGGMKIAYLMRQPQEYRDEDMAEEAKRVDEQERARVRDISSDGLTGTIKVKTS